MDIDEDSQPSDKLRKTSQDHITLGVLLQKKRSTVAAQEVEQIMASTLSIEDKIARITEIDRHMPSASESSSFKSPRNKESQETITPSLPPGLVPLIKAESSVSAHRSINRIYKQPTSNSLFRYLISDYRLIKKWGYLNHTIVTGFIPFKLFLNSDIKTFFYESLTKRHCPFLASVLVPIIEGGWKHLSKKEYNLLALFSQLIETLKSLDFEDMDLKDKMLFQKILKVYKLFLAIHHHSDYPFIIKASLERWLTLHKVRENQISQVLNLTKRMIDPEGSLPSLYNFFLAVNMLASRRFLTMACLKTPITHDVISHNNFQCSETIQESINTFLIKIVNELEQLHRDRKQITLLRMYLPLSQSNTPDFTGLKVFFDLSQDNTSFRFSNDEKNILKFMINFITAFGEAFEAFLTREIVINEKTSVRIFAKNFFHLEFLRLRSIVPKIEKCLFDFPFFHRSRYKQLKSAGKGATALEAEAIQYVDDALSVFLSMGKNLSFVISERQKYDSTNNDALEKLVLNGKPFMIPYEISIIKSSGFLAGKNIVESINYIAAMCYLLCLFFYSNELKTILENDSILQNRINELLAIVERIADVDFFQSVVMRYQETNKTQDLDKTN